MSDSAQLTSGRSPGDRLSRLFGRLPTVARRAPTPRVAGARDGRVEEFSATLAGGWVVVEIGAPSVEVVLRVNDRPVARTSAGLGSTRSVPGSDVRGFRFLLADLWTYVGPADRLTVTAGDAPQPLPIAGHGTELIPSSSGGGSVQALFTALEGGSLFNRFGRLQQSRLLATAWQQRVTSAADLVLELIHRHFEYDGFYTYGSMLGAVREHGFLGHDDDLDLGYVSRHRTGDEMGAEMGDIAMMLIDNGLSVEPFGPLLHVYRVDGKGKRGQRVDLFPFYFGADGLLKTPWGMAGTSHVNLDQWAGVVQVPFGDRTAPVPANADAFLAQFYGDTWREPQPGFSWRLDMTEKDTRAKLPDALANDVYWADFYGRITFTEPSDFCQAVLARDDCPAVVLDLGCGDGRDSAAFVRAGRHVIALDTSPAALQRLRERQLDGATGSLTVAQCDVTDPGSLAPHILSSRDGEASVLFYLRFLHDPSPDQDDRLLATLTEHAHSGDFFAAEFRSAADAKLKKAHPSPRRLFRECDSIARRLTDEGWTVLTNDHGQERSVYGSEDPDLHRVIATR